MVSVPRFVCCDREYRAEMPRPQPPKMQIGELVTAAELLQRFGPVEGLGRLVAALGDDDAESPGVAAAALEFALEGLYLLRRISKDVLPGGGRSVYGHA